MMFVIPTYEVVIDPDGDARRVWRVPRDDLEGFLRVLVFNDEADFRVMREPSPAESAVQAHWTPVAPRSRS